MADIEFYNVKTRQKVQVPVEKIRKTKYEKTSEKGVQVRYAIRAEYEGSKLTKFVSKVEWDKLNVPEE